MIINKEDYNPQGWFLFIFIGFSFFILKKTFSVKNERQFQRIKIIAFLLTFIMWFLLYLIASYIYNDYFLYKESLALGFVFFLGSIILEWKHIPYWIDGENKADFQKNALAQIDILQTAYEKHNTALVLEHLQYLKSVIEEERFEEIHTLENPQSGWDLTTKFKRIFKEIEKENNAKIHWQTYRKEIKKPLNLLKDYLDLLRVSEE